MDPQRRKLRLVLVILHNMARAPNKHDGDTLPSSSEYFNSPGLKRRLAKLERKAENEKPPKSRVQERSSKPISAKPGPSAASRTGAKDIPYTGTSRISWDGFRA
jgi:hypothetical protein